MNILDNISIIVCVPSCFVTTSSTERLFLLKKRVDVKRGVERAGSGRRGVEGSPTGAGGACSEAEVAWSSRGNWN